MRERVTVEPLLSSPDLYSIVREGQPTLVGGAASTIIALSHIIFGDEAQASPQALVEGRQDARPRPTG